MILIFLLGMLLGVCMFYAGLKVGKWDEEKRDKKL